MRALFLFGVITMCKLSRQSANSDKPNKANAQVILKTLAEQYPESIPDLAKLYTYFMPPLPKKVTSNFQWVAQAIGRKDVRYYLNYVYVTSSQFIGTDGHRLHVAPNDTGLVPGFYFANGDMAHDTDYAIYPDWERILNPDKEFTINIDTDLKLYDLNQVNPKWLAYVIQDIGVNKVYLDQAVNGLDNPTIALHKDKKQFKIVSGDRMAIVMPLRV